MPIISNFTVNGEAKRGILWSPEREMFLLRSCQSLMLGSGPLITSNVVSEGIWLNYRLIYNSSSEYGQIMELVFNGYPEPADKNEYYRILANATATYKFVDDSENVIEQKTVSAIDLFTNHRDTYQRLSCILERPVYANKFYIRFDNLASYDFSLQLHEYLFRPAARDPDTQLLDPAIKLGFPPVNYVEGEDVTTYNRYTEAREINDVNAILKYNGSIYTYDGNGCCKSSNPAILEIDSRIKFKRTYIGCSKEMADAAKRPVTMAYNRKFDFNFDPYDTLNLNPDSTKAAKISEFESRFGASTGWYVDPYLDELSDIVPTYLTFGCMFACDVSLGDGHTQQDQNWNNVRASVHVGKVTGDGEEYWYMMPSNVAYSDYNSPIKKLFTNTYGGKTWHYYYWECGVERQLDPWLCIGAPRLQINYNSTPFELRYLSAFMTIH